MIGGTGEVDKGERSKGSRRPRCRPLSKSRGNASPVEMPTAESKGSAKPFLWLVYIYIYIRGIADGCGRPTSSAAWPSKGETGEQEPGESRVSVGTMCREGEMGLVSVNSSIGFEAV